MKRKILSLILVAAMLASMLVFAPSTGASEAPVKIEVTNAAGVAGDTVTVDVILTATTVQTFSLGFEYDESKLENVTWTAGSGAILPIAMEDQFANCGLADFKSDAELSANFLGFGAATAKAVDASEGVKLGTITFTIKDTATIGDAYVRFVFVEGVNMAESTAVAPYTTADKFEFVDGKVTVMPEGYASVEATDASLFTFDAATGTITGCTAEGDVVIPAFINGVAVTAIGSYVFNGGVEYADEFYLETVTSITIPATVLTVADYAFLAVAAESVYVSSAATTFGAAATGYYAYEGDFYVDQYNAGTNKKPVWVNTTTLYAPLDSGAATFAATEDPDGLTLDCEEYNAGALVVYNVDGEALVYEVDGANVALLGSTVAGDKTVIAWTDGTNTYAPGAAIAVDGALALEAITVTTPKTANGASIKKAAAAEDLAIRFTADIAQADYAALVEAFGAANVKLGMLVTPQKYVNNAGAFTKEALTAYAGVNAYVDIAVTGYHEKDDVAGTYTLAGSLTGFSAKTILKNPDFVAVAYISVDVDGDGTVDTTVYGQYDYHTARNVLDVATLANNASTDATEKGLLATIIGWFTNGSKN